MKSFKYILATAVVAMTMTSCMDGNDKLTNDDWKAPDLTVAPFGNNNLKETNVITIAELKTKFADVVFGTTTGSTYSDANKLIEEDIQIKGRVTGNDLGGNIYKQIAIQDETAAIIICINQGGLNGYLALGQEILVNLKGLYIGCYGKQPEIGTVYNVTSIGRMNQEVWNEHFKILDVNNIKEVEPVDFDAIKNDPDANCGKLVTIKDVEMAEADGSAVFAPTDGSVYLLAGCANRSIKGRSNVVIRTSTYADFASMIMPSTKGSITGIATRYYNKGSDTWQILCRRSSDLQFPKGN